MRFALAAFFALAASVSFAEGVRYDTTTNEVLGVTIGVPNDVWPNLPAGQATAEMAVVGLAPGRKWTDGTAIRLATPAERTGWDLGRAKAAAKQQVDRRTVELFEDLLTAAEDTMTPGAFISAVVTNANGGRSIKNKIDAAADIAAVKVELAKDNR